MKKLKLDFQQLNAEVLTRSQLKQILGGDGSSGGSGNRACTTTTECQVWYGMNCGCMSDHICGCIVA